MPSAQPLRTGDPRTLGRYELSGRLGEGGQGVVYLGALAGESYAVKLLHGPVGDGRGAFLREVELAKHVARFCTAQVVEAGFDEGRAYIVSEYVDGPSLAREVMLTGPRRDGALERLAVGTATAIAAIHRAGIVHRDLKPQNVLLGPDGPRVIDFGLARALDAAATLTNRSVGTPAYMAPEQITATAVTGAVDVFSWGATMCFAANGTAPFGQDSVAPVLHRILTAPPNLGSLDGRLRELVTACLEKDARNRPTSRELLLELLGSSDGVPAEVLRSPPPHILRVPSPRPDPDPVPLAEPESTDAAAGYRLPEPDGSAGSPEAASGAEDAHPGSEQDSRDAPAADPEITAPDLPLDAAADIEHRESGSSARADGQSSQFGGAAYRGSPAGYPVERVARPEAPPMQEGRPEAPPVQVGAPPGAPPGALPVAQPAAPPVAQPAAQHAVQPQETQPGRRRVAGSAGLAVGGALLVTAGVLATLLVPMLQENGTPAGAGGPTSAPTVEPRKAESSTVKEKPPARERERANTPPPSKDPVTPRPVEIPVPTLVGLSRAAAVKALERAGLAAGDVNEVDSRRKIGQVVGSRPAAGARVVKGTAVALEVSAGVKVPTVAGMRRGAAEDAIKGAGLKVGGVSSDCSTEPDGQVLSSAPKGGARVSGGTSVSLVVAKHGAPVPGVAGQSRDGALAAIRAAGFDPVVRTQVVENESQWNTAIAQTPAPDTCAAPGGRVVVTVGAEPPDGPDPTEPTISDTPDPSIEP